LIHRYSEGLSKEDFYKNQEKQDVLIHRLEIMGEASKRLSDDIIDAFPEIPWKQIKGMRDVLIHQYDDIMLEIVWETVQKRIPEIEHNLRKIKNIVGRILEVKKELPELLDGNRKEIFILKNMDSNYFVLISNILKEKEIKFKLVNSIEDINFNEGQREIILFHFDTIDKFDFINENIIAINLQK
ncbi:MAG: DUF86 domain-containing protein, partial [Bacillota bacterium]